MGCRHKSRAKAFPLNGMTGDINCDVMNMFVPECTDGTMGYYYRSSPRYTGSGVSELTDSLLTAAKAQDEIYIFYIDDSLDFDESLRTLFTDEPQLFFDCVSEVNSRLENYSIDSSHLGYYPFKKTRIAAVELHYY